MTESEALEKIATELSFWWDELVHPTTWKDCKCGSFLLAVVAVAHRGKRHSSNRRQLCLLAGHIFSLTKSAFESPERIGLEYVKHSLQNGINGLHRVELLMPYTSYPDDFDYGLMPALTGLPTAVGIALYGFLDPDTRQQWTELEAHVADIVRLYFPEGETVLSPIINLLETKTGTEEEVWKPKLKLERDQMDELHGKEGKKQEKQQGKSKKHSPPGFSPMLDAFRELKGPSVVKAEREEKMEEQKPESLNLRLAKQLETQQDLDNYAYALGWASYQDMDDDLGLTERDVSFLHSYTEDWTDPDPDLEPKLPLTKDGEGTCWAFFYDGRVSGYRTFEYKAILYRDQRNILFMEEQELD